MSYFTGKRYIKVISVLLVLLLLWQGVVWAYPDLTKPAKLQAESSLASPHRSEFLKKSALRFIKNYILVAELDLVNGNLISIKECINEAVDQMKNIKDMPRDFLENLRPGDDHENTGYIIVDAGDCLIKYYTPKIEGAADLPEGYRLEGEERTVSLYLNRQILVNEASDHRGFMARGDHDVLYKEFKKANPILTPLRPSLNHKRNSRPAIAVDLLKRLEKSKERFYAEEVTLISGAIAKFAEARLVEFDPPVLADPEDPTKAAAWLFGFNTTALPEEVRFRNTYNEFSRVIRAESPGTIGFATPVLDLIQADKPTLHEYILHELICPYFGHGRAREIQEILFRENYSGIVGDKRSGHMDGQLSFAIQSIILQRCEPLPEAVSAEDLAMTDLSEFRKYDFMGEGPQKVARFEGPFRRNYERARAAWLTEQMRSSKVSKARFRKVLDEVDRVYAYIKTKTEWIWSTKIEALWEKMDSALKEEDIQKARRLAKELLEKHYSFMSKRRNAPLKNDKAVKMAAEKIKVFLRTGTFKKHLRARSSGAPVSSVAPAPSVTAASRTGEKKQTVLSDKEVKREDEQEKKNKTTYKGYPGGFFKWFWVMGFVWYMTACLIALPIAVILAIVLPVNLFTAYFAVLIPLAVFITMLVINWSWKNLFMGIAFSVLISYLFPVPWYGLALAIVIVGMALFQRGYASRIRGGIIVTSRLISGRKAYRKDKKEQEKEKREPAPDREKAEGSRKEDEETRTRKILERVNISPDILQYLAGINALLVKNPQDTDPESITTQDVLDVVFREEPVEVMQGDKELKEELRARVFYKLQEIEDTNINFELNIAIAHLRNWEQLTDGELAGAFQEVVNEIANEVSSWSGGRDTEEMIAIQDLIGEYYGIPEKRMNHIRIHMLLKRAYEQLDEDKLVGVESVDTYYMIGRVEFYFQHYRAAADAFAQCVEMGPSNTDFHFALGFTKHCMKKWPDAEESYKQSLALRKKMPGPTEVDKLKIKLTELLIKKARQKVPIEGKEKKDQVKDAEDKNSPASIELLKKKLFPGLKEDEYSLFFAPVLEESLFFLVPALASHFIFGLDIVGIIAVMAASRAIFFLMHKGARPNAPPAGYKVPAFVAFAGFIVALIPLVILPAYYTSPLLVISLLSFISYQIHFFTNLFALQKKVKPASMKDKALSEVRIAVVGEDIKDMETAVKGVERVYRRVGWEEYEGHMLAYIKLPNKKIYLAMQEEEVVGFLVTREDVLSEAERNSSGKPTVHISTLGVDPEFSKKGVGTLLMEKAVDDNIERADRIQVISEPSAFGFYQKFAERKGYTFRYFFTRGPDGEGKYYIFFREKPVLPPEGDSPGKDHTSDIVPAPEEIEKNAKKTVPALIQALIDVSAKNKGRKIILALDAELGEGSTNRLVKKLIRVFSEIKSNNSDLAVFLKNLEIVRGEGKDLADKLRIRAEVSDARKAGKEDVIVVTKNENLVYYNGIAEKAAITAVDDQDLSDTSYLPLFEVVLFSVGRYLGWDKDTLQAYYNMIPNALPLSEMQQEDYYDLFEGGKSLAVIKLLPGAKKLTGTEIQEVFDSLKTVLSGA